MQKNHASQKYRKVPIFSDLYAEKVLIIREDSELSDETGSAIRHAISSNNAVGCIGGCYDDELSILFMTEFVISNLGYDYDSFMKATGGSLKALIYRDDLQYFEDNRFREGSGPGIFRMLMSDGTPIYVRTFKTESADSSGKQTWTMAVHIVWDAQNLELVNNIFGAGVWYIDFNRDASIKKVTWSQKFRQILGFTGPEDFPDEFSAWSDIIHPSDRQRVLDIFAAAAADASNETKYEVEYRAKCADGRYHRFRERGEVNRRIDGTPSRMTGLIVNIDEEFRSREESSKLSAFHRAYSKSNLCEYYVDLKENTFECIKINQNLTEHCPDTATWDELANMYLTDHVCEENRRTMRLLLNRSYIRSELKKIDGELNFDCRTMYSGVERWIRNIILPVDMDEQGMPWHVIIFMRDITKSRRAEEDLTSMAKDIHDMDELLGGMVRLVKRFAVCDLVENSYTLHNLDGKHLLKTSGTYDELVEEINAKYKSLSDKMTLPELLSCGHLREFLRSETDTYNFEYCSGDETLFKNMSAIPLEFAGGQLSRVLLIIQDVTQAKKSEREARTALKEAYLAADRANKAKTIFMSNMSHDIRTPMNAIIGMTAIASANIDDKNRVIDCLEKITHSSRHLLGLINEVLDMGRIESGEITLMQEEFQLPDFVDDLIAIIKPAIDEHGHELSIALSGIRHESVIGDRMRIQQVLVNIMTNAVKYTPNGGKIRLTISEKFHHRKNICYEFTVEDNGIGMTEDFLKIIFEPFTRADDKRTGKIPGTGLGMAITKNIISMMNGDIEVESEVGKGSRFIVTIVLKSCGGEEEAVEALDALPVLVVDDDRVCCEGTCAILNEIGMNGEWVLSGKEAVERCVKRHDAHDDFFAVIIDWKMPEMDGVQTTREIRSRVGNEVPIIVFTAYDCYEVEEEARAAGANMFLTKPLFRSRLVALFSELAGTGNRACNTAVESDIEKLEHTNYSEKRVLIVEDNELNREIAQNIIGMTGAKIETAENGKIAFDMIAEKGADYYDIIFMDIQMPVMNGYEATKAIRGLPRCGSVPIVAMTANAFTEDVILAKNAGMNDHLSKPVDINKLGEIMKKWLAKKHT